MAFELAIDISTINPLLKITIHPMKHILPIILVLFFYTAGTAQTFTTIQNGDWDNTSTWQNGQIPDLTVAQSANPYQVNILHDVTATNSSGNIGLDGTSSLYIASGASLTIDGLFEVESGATSGTPFHLAGTLNANRFIFNNSTATVTHSGTLVTQADFEVWDGTYDLEGTVNSGDDVEVFNAGILQATNATITAADLLVGYDDSEIYLNQSDLTVMVDMDLRNNHVFELNSGSTLQTGRDLIVRNSAAFYATDATINSDDDMEGYNDSEYYLSNTTITLYDDLKLEDNHIFELADGSSLDANVIKLYNQASVIGIGPSNTLTVNGLESYSSSAALVCAYGGTMSNTTTGKTPIEEFQQTCAQSAAVLPVTWLAFEATASTIGVELYWSTAEEANSDYFDVERSSDDGLTWTSIGRVASVGTSQEISEYTYLDRTAPTTTSIYYRLRQVDLDGTSNYSPIATVETLEKRLSANIAVYPNPTTDFFSVELDEQTKLNQVALHDAFGRTYPIEYGSDALQFELPSHVQSGTYLLVLDTNQGNIVKRLVVNR